MPSNVVRRMGLTWQDLRSSLWFVPTLLVLGSAVLAILMIEAESYVVRERLMTRWPRIFGAGAEGARGMLSAIAGSMITVAGVAFSITIVAFTLAASQYTSRILRAFMRDRASQAVLGILLGVFVYCLVVLRTIRGGEEDLFVPSLAVLGAVILALIAIGFLVFFIHHVSDLIQASSIIKAVTDETLAAVDRLYPEHSAPGDHRADPASEVEANAWTGVPARMTGYVQAVNGKRLAELAREHNTLIRMERGVGDFVVEDTPIVSLAGKQPDEPLAKELNAAFSTGRHRTVHQDAGYGVRQIVDIALKALSPAINDTTTAVICIDHLGAILVRLADRSLSSPREIGDGQSRLIHCSRTFRSFVAEAFDQIRQNGKDNPAVLARLLDTLALISGRTDDPERRDVLRQQALAVIEAAENNITSAHDRVGIQTALKRGSIELGGGGEDNR